MDSSNNVSNLHVLGAVNQVAQDAAMANGESTSAILQQQAGTNFANMAQTERLNIAIEDTVDKHSLALLEAVERNGKLNDNSTNTTVDRIGHENLLSTERNAQNINHLLDEESSHIQIKQENHASSIRSSLEAYNTAAVILCKDELLQYCAENDKLIEQASTIVNATALDIQEMESSLALIALKDATSIELEAFKAQSQLASEAEECCCELKVEVAKTEYQTQKEARNLDSIRIRGELSNAYTEILINKFKCPPPPRPCPPPPCPCPCPPPPCPCPQ